jgi:hypothetical protein
MARPKPQPHVDLMRIDFPSDRLTIKELRELFPQIDSDELNDFDEIELPGLLSLERDLARAAFDEALGRTPRQKGIFVRGIGAVEEDRQMLAATYLRYRLATGLHHAEQLIRAFEQAAAEMASQHMPNRPTR